MPTMNKKSFNEKLNKLISVIGRLNIAQHNVGIATVDKLIELKDEYTKLSNDFGYYTLNKEQIRLLKEAKEQYTSETRSVINRKIADASKEKTRIDQKNKAYLEQRNQKISEAKTLVDTSFPHVRSAAKECLKATTSTIDEKITQYKALSKQLREAIDSLESEERLKQLYELNNLAQSVNQYKLQMDTQDRNTLKGIQILVKEASRKTSQMTVEEMLLSLLGTKKTHDLLGTLDKKTTSLLNGNGTGSNVGTLALGNLTKSDQNAVVLALMNELSKMSSSSTQSATLAKFVNAMEKDLDALMTGKKTHLSILFDDKGLVGSVHIDVLDLIKNPERTISELFYRLYKNGVGADASVVMTVTSPIEVNALLQLNNLELSAVAQIGTLEELTGQVIRSASNPQELAQIVTHKPDNGVTKLNHRPLVQSTNRKGLEAEEILSLLGVVTIIFEAKRLLVSTPTKEKQLGLSSSNTNNVGVLSTIQYIHMASSEQINDVTDVCSQYTKVSKSPGFSYDEEKVLDEGDKLTKPKVDLTTEFQQFYSSLRELADIYSKLSKKGRHGNKLYQETAEKVLIVYVNIKDAGENFFANPNPATLTHFSDVTVAQVQSIDPVLQIHRGNLLGRGLLLVLNGLLGLLAALTVLPALIIEASTDKGYVGTFFSLPETQSAKAFQSVKRGLVEQGVNSETKVMSPYSLYI
ncbi:hypothetical protein [uncultured Legionella sp.]|uniref:hypothetical protein n=1 Tax=uncultured Legionella sp. TaxID=210934 RepID=UPI00261FAE63|nr:hypothetical protein [uncultured Legionella sp.]